MSFIHKPWTRTVYLPNNRTCFSLIHYRHYLDKLLDSITDFTLWIKKAEGATGVKSGETSTLWQGRKSTSLKSAQLSTCLYRATPIPATLRKYLQSQPVWQLASSWNLKTQIGQTQVHAHCVTHVPPRLLKLGNDSMRIQHYSYFQGCKWCGASALMQKLPQLASANQTLFLQQAFVS